MTENKLKVSKENPQIKIALAEDESIIRLDLEEILESKGFNVVGSFSNGEDLLNFVSNNEVDLVILDIKMPKKTGIEIGQEINDIPIILLTAFSEEKFISDAIKIGAMAYVVKPFSEADILPAIKLAFAKHQELKQLKKEKSKLEEKFEIRKLIDIAKGLLIQHENLTEAEAFSWIQKSAMDKRTTMKNVAEKIIENFS